MNKKKKVCIVGFAPSTKDKAYYNNDEWEIWVLNEWYTCLQQATNISRWFEIHQRETVVESKRSEGYLQALKDSKIPIYMVKEFEDIPMSRPYPLDDIRAALKTDYFTNSISYMVAMAIYEGYEAIHLFGVDMAQDEEYSKERPSVEYFIGYATSKGIDVYIPPESDICKIPYFYGFEEASAHKICTTIDPKKEDLTKRLNSSDQMVDECLERIDFQLKEYLFNKKPEIDKIKLTLDALSKTTNELKVEENIEKKNVLQEKLQELQKTPININNVIIPLDTTLMNLWNLSQQLKGHKKERLFLSGASEMAVHLRKLLCPYD